MWLLHILAFLFFFPALFVTIPLHIIIGIIEPPKEKKQDKWELAGWRFMLTIAIVKAIAIFYLWATGRIA